MGILKFLEFHELLNDRIGVELFMPSLEILLIRFQGSW